MKKSQRRQMARDLPEAIELISLMMQAGLDFQVALQRYVLDGPDGTLKSQLQITVRAIQLGTPRVEALRQLALRCDEPGLLECVKNLIQGLELGASLTPLLRGQAAALRRRRAYEAEKKAATTPLKLLFPLFVFIFPTIFLVLLGPIWLSYNRVAG
jgi:tight adherence protein C